MRWFAVCLVLAACKYEHGGLPQDGNVVPIDTDQLDALGNDAVIDGPPSCTTTCGATGVTCVGNTCSANPGAAISCTATSPCNVSCLGDTTTCENGMSCGIGANCTYQCDADHTCDGTTLTCEAGSSCDIHCTGDHACDGLTILCGGGASCIYHCCGAHSCSMSFSCTGLGCSQSNACP